MRRELVETGRVDHYKRVNTAPPLFSPRYRYERTGYSITRSWQMVPSKSDHFNMYVHMTLRRKEPLSRADALADAEEIVSLYEEIRDDKSGLPREFAKLTLTDLTLADAAFARLLGEIETEQRNA